jgi:hypothetical protein
LTLVVLRLQVGRWFATGYSLTPDIYPNSAVHFSVPKPNEYRFGIPLATAAYCFWPCSPVLGLVGFLSARGAAKRLGILFGVSSLACLVFYVLCEFGRGGQNGFGPRYHVPLVVPLAVGTGVALSGLWRTSLARLRASASLPVIAPALVASTSILLAVAYIGCEVYPRAVRHARGHNELQAIERAAPSHAVVFGGQGLNETDPMDLPQNLPLDLYPEQDVLIAVAENPLARTCVRNMYPTRRFYVALPGRPVRLEPL